MNWRADATIRVPKFPEPEKSTLDDAVSQSTPSIISDESSSSFHSSSQSRSSSLGKRRRPDKDNDDDDDDDNNNYSGGGGGGGRARGRLAVRAHQPRVPSPLQHYNTSNHDEEAGGGGASSGSKTHALTIPRSGFSNREPPQQPFQYCTQACLLGLARGRALDHSCPNVSFHRRTTGYHLEAAPPSEVHPVPPGQLAKLVRLQLLRDLERDCKCFVDMGFSGAVGYLFKITLTGYGYTFVAKGVESRHSKRLVRESRVYEDLKDLQGQLIPVHLGLIELAIPYPIVNFVSVTHMMLLSYAGLSFYSERLERRAARLGLDVDWDKEGERTAQELQAAGLVDEDEDNVTNMMWCEDTQRAMRIDFDHAYVVKPQGLK